MQVLGQTKISLENLKQKDSERIHLVASKNDDKDDKEKSYLKFSLVSNNKPEKRNWRTAINESNKLLTLSNYHLQFKIDKDSERIQVKLIDDETKKVIREIPPEQILRLSALIKERIETYHKLTGIFVDKVA